MALNDRGRKADPTRPAMLDPWALVIVAASRFLTNLEKRVWREHCDLDFCRGAGCWLSEPDLAERLGCNRSQAGDARRRLSRLGLLLRLGCGRRVRWYPILPEGVRGDVKPVSKEVDAWRRAAVLRLDAVLHRLGKPGDDPPPIARKTRVLHPENPGADLGDRPENPGLVVQEEYYKQVNHSGAARPEQFSRSHDREGPTHLSVTLASLFGREVPRV